MGLLNREPIGPLRRRLHEARERGTLFGVVDWRQVTDSIRPPLHQESGTNLPPAVGSPPAADRLEEIAERMKEEWKIKMREFLKT